MAQSISIISKTMAITLGIALFAIVAFAQGKDEQLPPGKIFGEISLVSNWLEYGITQSDKSFALQTLLGYRWTQFRMGMWGSNSKFQNSDDTLNLRFFGAYEFIFTSTSSMTVRYDMSRYFKGGDHNGSIQSIDLLLFDYHVGFEKNDRFEGTETELTRYGFWKSFDSPWAVRFDLGAGYNMLDADGMSNFFDLRAQGNYKVGDATTFLGLTYNSGSSQFSGRADLSYYLGLKAGF